jgi:voltage-gated potassium channel
MEKTNFFYLLGALLFLLLALPLAHDLGLAHMPIMRAIIFSVALLVGIWSLKKGGRFFVLGMLFVVGGIALSVLAANLDMMLFQYGSMLAMIGFLIVAISYTLGQVVFGTQMSANRLVGAICVFLLLGIIWSFAYSLLELAIPNSFKGFSPGVGPGADTSWLYFSFVTLTTLGYGDITPVTAVARTLTYLQAVAGQFYIAVLVAGLVSAYISSRQKS